MNQTASATVISSRQISEQELEAYRVNQLSDRIIRAMNDHQETVRFLAVGKVSGKYNLVEIKRGDLLGSYDLNAGTNHFYTFKLSDVAHFIESVCEKSQIRQLNGEFDITEK